MVDIPRDMPSEIRFYRADEKPFGAFSNLFKRPIRFGARDFPTSEHAYQFQKPRTLQVREWLMAAPSPALLAMAAHGLYTWDVVEGWSKKKIPFMRCVLWAKFGQHRDLLELLLATSTARLVESAGTDNATNRFWGEVETASNGYQGKNWLGQLLMGVREDFRTGTIGLDALHGIAEGLDPDTGKPDPAFVFHPNALDG